MNINPFEILHQELKSVKQTLQEMQTQLLNLQTQQPADELLTLPEAAKFLKISMNTLYNLAQKGKIPYSKPSKRLYFSKKELVEWMLSKRRKTLKELDAEAEETARNNSRGKKGGKR